MHRLLIIHRDIKPENILFKNPLEAPGVVLAEHLGTFLDSFFSKTEVVARAFPLGKEDGSKSVGKSR